MEGIVEKYLRQLRKRALERGIRVSFPPQLAAGLCANVPKEGGARQLRRIVEEQVEGPLAAYLLTRESSPKEIKAQWKNGAVSFI